MEESPDLDPVIHQRVRLRIMSALHRNRHASFTQLRNGLGLTDGNLASHAGKLEEAGYVKSRRVLLGRDGFELRYAITPAGAAAFQSYAHALTTLLEESNLAAEADAAARSP